MKTQRTSARTGRLDRAPRGTDRNRLVGALSVSIVVMSLWAGRVMGALPDRLAALSATASADDGNRPMNTLDGSLATRWSALGDGQWIRFDLASPTNVGAVKIAWFNGDRRKARFDIQISHIATNWTTIFSGQSSGTTKSLESYEVTYSSGQYVRIVGHGTSIDLWNSIAEVELYASSLVMNPGGSDNPRLNVSRTTGSPNGVRINLNWTGLPGAISQVQASSNLVTWEDVDAAITNSSAGQTWQDDIAASSAKPVRFYRVKQNSASPRPGNGLPSSLLDLTNWKLTLPVNTSHAGSPDEILQPELNGFQDQDYFHANTNTAGTGVVFLAPCGGATTSGSGYPRSELREMMNNGASPAAWSTTSGTHTMEITEAITHLPEAKPHVVAGQIHGPNDDLIVFRLEGTKLFIDQNGDNGPVLTTNYRLGDVFTAKFVARNGGVECYYNGQYVYTYTVSASGCYFKAGCYTQSNTSRGDAPTAYGEVIIYRLSVAHQ